MPFALDSSPDISEVSEAINYLLANYGGSVTASSSTGQITGPTGQVTGYLYKYISIKYADSFDGTVNFSDIPASHLYFGIRNNNSSTESSNPADYIWNAVSGGFGGTKSLWYIATGGRQIQFAASVNAPDTGWVVDPGSAIDLDVVTSGNIPVIAEAFFPYFTPSILQVPRTGGVTPVFTNIIPVMYATDKGAVVAFTNAQTDTNAAFVNNSWRIGNSSTTGYADISLTNITIGNPTDAGDYAQWPAPTAMSSSPAYITVPVRYKNSLGVVTQAGTATVQLVFVDPGATGATGSAGPTIDISGYTGFVQNSGGAYTPASATLTAITTNVTAPTYSWVISGATPTSASTASVVVTPTSSATNVTVTLTVNGSNLSSTISKTMVMPITYNGATGQAGANGVMSAFPTIFQWTGSSTPPTRPTTTSTYTWSTGAYTAPSGWYTQAPSNTTAGNYLWSITIPLNEVATVTTSTLDWTNTSYPIRAVAFNGYNGANGNNGANGSNGSATFLVTRAANDSSAPTDAEVTAAIGRTPVAGDIVTVSYNNSNNAIVYRYVTSWILQTTYITGSLIVQNTITADKMVTTLLSADNVLTRNLTVRDNSGNIILSSGQNLDYSRITASSGWLNSNITISGGTISGIGTGSGTAVANNAISINANGTLSGAGTGAVSLTGLGAGSFATLSQITSANATTYIAGAAIGTAQIGVLTAGNIGANTIDASKIAANTITAGQIAANTITANELSSITVSASKNIKVGTAAVSGTTMTGAGGILNGNGTLALGNASTNISFNGTQMTLNGNVVATDNINNNAVTNTVAAYSTSYLYIDQTNVGTGWTTIQTASINALGKTLVIWGTAQVYLGDSVDQPSSGRTGLSRILKDSSTVIYTNNYGNGVDRYTVTQAVIGPITDVPTSGSHTYEFQIRILGNDAPDYSPINKYSSVESRSLIIMELKK